MYNGIMSERILIFDFDGTLSTETWPKFWVWAKKFGYNGVARNDALEAALADYRATHDGDHLETFFGFFDDLIVKNQAPVTHAELMEGEQYIVYNPGVEDFLARSTARKYIVSGGLVEFLKHLRVAKYFDGIYGSPVELNAQGEVVGIGEIMTNAKKIAAIQQVLDQNGRTEDDCAGVFYIGDGYSDADSMRYVHERGGKAVFVHQPDTNDEFAAQYNTEVYEKLAALGVVDYNVVADYRQGSELSKILEGGLNE